jgi:Ran GTPase-activating protein (RanGAP) involved in mRNA processing and transport
MTLEEDHLQKLALQRRRGELMKELADIADQIKGIDQQIAILQSQELEKDLSRCQVDEERQV